MTSEAVKEATVQVLVTIISLAEQPQCVLGSRLKKKWQGFSSYQKLLIKAGYIKSIWQSQDYHIYMLLWMSSLFQKQENIAITKKIIACTT